MSKLFYVMHTIPGSRDWTAIQGQDDRLICVDDPKNVYLLRDLADKLVAKGTIGEYKIVQEV